MGNLLPLAPRSFLKVGAYDDDDGCGFQHSSLLLQLQPPGDAEHVQEPLQPISDLICSAPTDWEQTVGICMDR